MARNKLMKISSYLFPVTMKKFNSSKNGLMDIQYVSGKKVLNSLNANYSYGSLHKVFEYTFSKLGFNSDPNKKVLILGFGAGSIKTILRNNYKFNGKIIGVEHDKEIIKVAREEFNLKENYKYFDLQEKDALVFLEENEKRFNLIIIDLYLDLEIPKKFLSEYFFNLLKKGLAIEGRIIFNLLINEDRMETILSLIDKLNFSKRILKVEMYGHQHFILQIK